MLEVTSLASELEHYSKALANSGQKKCQFSSVPASAYI